MMYFFYSCRKFCFASTVYDMYFRTKTKCCSGSIHSYVTTTDNGNFLTCCDRCIVRIIKCLHQVTSCQVFICREYSVGCLARDSHEHRKTCSGTDEYSFKIFLFHQLVDGCRFTDNNVCLEFNAKLFDFFDFFLNNFLLWKTEFRNTIYQNTTKFMQCFEYSYFVSEFCKVAGTGKS